MLGAGTRRCPNEGWLLLIITLARIVPTLVVHPARLTLLQN